MRTVTQPPFTGDVFWCERFPGLHGNPEKERYAIVISPPDRLPDAHGHYLVVPTSSSSLKSRWAVQLPNRADNPNTSSGLPEPCSAVCDEYKLVPAGVLTRWVGDLRSPLVTKLQTLVREVVVSRAGGSGPR